MSTSTVPRAELIKAGFARRDGGVVAGNVVIDREEEVEHARRQ